MMPIRQICKLRSLRILFISVICITLFRCWFEVTSFYSDNVQPRQYRDLQQGLLDRNRAGNVVLRGRDRALPENYNGPGKDLPTCNKTSLHVVLPRILSSLTTDWASWKYRKTATCKSLFLKSYTRLPRHLLSIKCKSESSGKQNVHLGEGKRVQNMNFGSDCLEAFIEECCRDTKPVPNIVHFIWYGRSMEFSFFGLLSFISVLRFIKPCVVLIHGNFLPSGVYWNFVLGVFPNVIHVKQRIRTEIFDKHVSKRAHISDVMRIEALLKYGGIYLDMDMVFVKEIDAFRQYPCTMSRMRRDLLQSSFIMAMKNATFLQKWLDGYKYHYRNDSYIYSAMNYPSQLSYNHSDLIHVESETLSRPWSQHGDKIFNSNFNWSFIYGMHLYSRTYHVPINETSIRQMNTTLGAISRHILFGNKEMCVN